MINDWLKSIFGRITKPEPQPSAGGDSDNLERFEAFLANRMRELRPSVHNAFALLFEAGLPYGGQGLQIEIFLDDPGFSFRVFSRGKDDVWADDPAPVQKLNDMIDTLWPIVTEDELDQYKIWETDPKWGRQVALEQPLDRLNIPKIVIPWLKDIVSETRGDFSRTVTVSVHDLTHAEEI